MTKNKITTTDLYRKFQGMSKPAKEEVYRKILCKLRTILILSVFFNGIKNL